MRRASTVICFINPHEPQPACERHPVTLDAPRDGDDRRVRRVFGHTPRHLALHALLVDAPLPCYHKRGAQSEGIEMNLPQQRFHAACKMCPQQRMEPAREPASRARAGKGANIAARIAQYRFRKGPCLLYTSDAADE